MPGVISIFSAARYRFNKFLTYLAFNPAQGQPANFEALVPSTVPAAKIVARSRSA